MNNDLIFARQKYTRKPAGGVNLSVCVEFCTIGRLFTIYFLRKTAFMP